jgi:hypothetical protein
MVDERDAARADAETLREALQWARDRLVYVYNENPNYDFIQMMDRAIGRK